MKSILCLQQLANPQMSPTEPGNSSESELDSDTEGAQELMIGDTPNKASVLKEMFKDIDSEKIACLYILSLLNGNVHRVVSSVCLKVLSMKTILRVFTSAKMLTRIKKLLYMITLLYGMVYASTSQSTSTSQNQ